MRTQVHYYLHIANGAPVYACRVVFEQIEQSGEPIIVSQWSLEELTLVVERELRGASSKGMRGTDYVYRVNVHYHFETADKGGLVIEGPYAKDIESAVSALEADLVQKIEAAHVEPELQGDPELVRYPLTAAVGGANVDEPRLPCATWAAVNVNVVTLEVAESQASREDVGCQGEYVQTI